ncbi:PAS domain S-box-containing protein [Paenibacillus sp. 1_12]|uniref:ATP-binding protein n=1 Tax=Paenibacillus sp. 1_12 TaxID=1566278 RepID=UPI0008DEC1DB|nr:ATP-binding protein [Paenibacillus sp. 1_12]SFL15463.1 PAS domain S-box-containing protein [Paenibacillus sp. 1_12]
MEAHYISESKKRCLEAGLQADILPFPRNRLHLHELHERKNKFAEAISVMDFFSDKTTKLLEGTPILITLTDDLGYIISFFGNEAIRESVEQFGIKEGIQFIERDMGTNVVDMALQYKRPVELMGTDHFHNHLHTAACYCVPFDFMNEVGGLTGTVSMMTLLDFHSKFALPLLINMVDSMQREIVLRRKNRNQNILNHMTLNTVNNGIIIADQAGSIIEFNQLIEKVTNCKREDVIGTSVLKFDLFAPYMLGVLQHGDRIENRECTLSLLHNKQMTCLLDAIPIVDDNQEIIGAYLQIRDITDRIMLEQQIIMYEKFSAIGKLAAGIAHEIRNPLTSVMGFIQLLREKKPSAETNRRYLDIVYNELIVLKKMVSDFVLMAKPSSPEKKEYVLQTIIEDTVQFMTSQANLKNAILTTDLCITLILISIDANQIKQVLINIIQNAFEAMPEGGGEVEISLTPNLQDNCVEITISDNGVGISEKQINEIFNPFYTTKENGLGLGLSICYRIIESHNGNIQIKSNTKYGTKFIITLPFQNS